ncbi:bifunctional diguanylate cyclase/phosphodiesterase [Roseibium denhamense]|nr:bifunctional diguanylate cyclase/phosphodiesterase [Roseibium denhamense]
MSLVLLLAAGVFASNRLLTHWLLIGSLEQTYSDKQSRISALLEPSVANTDELLTGLRFTDASSATPSGLSDTDRSAISSVLIDHKDAAPPKRLFSLTRGPQELAEAGNVIKAWRTERLLRASSTEKLVSRALQSGPGTYAIADMTWFGRFGTNSLIVFNPETDAKPVLIALVDQSRTLSSLRPLATTLSFVIGALCIASFLFAGLLLWLRLHDQVQTNRNIQYLAHHDTLTGLPNRAVFNARLTESLRLAQAKASNIGVMLIDVDKFKEINDTHGHGIGDVFLQIVAERLKAVFSHHLVARLSGDEFAVMMTSLSDPGRMTKLATDMINATEIPCKIEGKDIKISLSIGLARATDGSWRASRLLHCADLALYRAKHSGRSTFSWYTPELDADAQKRKEIELGLEKALKYDQLKLLYQPQYSLKDGVLKGYEALIRWEHPTRGIIRPDVFIPIAEDTGMIQEIGTWVLNHACREAAMWSDTARRVAVNMSPAQFVAGETQNRVAQALHASGLHPSRLEIEITESLLISNTDAVIETLQQIRSMGVSIAMDDFGTGYSSLSYLSLFPFDKIKIDKAFIHNLGKDPSTDAIVTSIIGLGRSLDVTITAEGVETENQVVLLRAAGCDLVQGYLYGKPDSVDVHETAEPEMAARHEARKVSRKLTMHPAMRAEA